MKIKREKAWELVEKHIKNENLRKHCLAVEAIMKALARHFKQDQQQWGILGLVHDLDWEKSKNQPVNHGLETEKILRKENFPEDIVRAAKIHNYLLGIQPKTLMEKALYCSEELSGLITATALVNPKKLEGVKVKSVMKKFKEKSFAKGVNREVIALSPEYLGISVEELVNICLQAMKAIRRELDL